MFNSLRGTLTEKGPDFVRLETVGVEWDVAVPGTAASVLPEIGAEVRLLVWMLHREDQMRLFGFADEAQRNAFLELLKVEGIGPRQAMKILSGIRTEDLALALDSGDVNRLEAVPGLGKKTAQKMVLALKGKLAESSPAGASNTAHGELVTALTEMGYERKAAIEAIARAEKESLGELPLDDGDKEQVLFKRAIVLLSKG